MVEATRVELQDFNPLPRKEGDFDLRCNSVCRCHISIHSLVKRETHFRLCRSKRQLFISIHSLVKRETRLLQQQRRKICNFNPLPRKEGDFDGGGDES